MRYVHGVSFRMRQFILWARSAWWSNRLRFIQGRNHRDLMIGPGTHFTVPVRSGGSGVLRIGANNLFGYALAPMMGNGEILLQPRSREAEILIGDRNSFSNNVSFIAMKKIVVGDRCLIGDQVAVFDCDFHEISPGARMSANIPAEPVIIGNNVWVGSRVMVLKGVTIGDNSVVGAMSVVTKSIPANCLAVGVPARVVRSIE